MITTPRVLPILLLLQRLDSRGRQVIPQDYFINNDLEYLKGGSLSRQYSTSITKTKAATYEVKWIEDTVPNLWSPVKVVYDKHAYWVASLKIMKWYDYSHLDEIEFHREDQELYKFKEAALSKKVNEESGEVHWWKRVRRRPQTA
ncbi:hypothetical protein Tco_0059054 [Tanacetum coccineum]